MELWAINKRCSGTRLLATINWKRNYLGPEQGVQPEHTTRNPLLIATGVQQNRKAAYPASFQDSSTRYTKLRNKEIQ